MRELIAITQVTLDGVMQGPGGPEEDPSGGFREGGWAMPFLDDDWGKTLDGLMGRDFDLLLGRKTYDIWVGYWPHHADTTIGAAFAKATKHVVTHRPDGLTWTTSKRLGATGDVVAEVRGLKRSKGPELHVWGSGEVLQALMAADLVDEHHLWVIPVVLGKGKRLFEEGLPPRGLRLVASERTRSGVLLTTYRPAGPVQKGSP
jgi:dihydrofolate reductase